MIIRTCLLLIGAWVSPWFLVAEAWAQDTESKKLESAFQWSREQFDKETAQAEKDYEQAVRAAQTARAEAIKMSRTRYTTGLDFLNSNPSLPQATRVKINDEMKRIAALPEPVAPDAPPMDQSESVDSDKSAGRKVTLKMDAPDSGWSVHILQSKKVNDEIWVLSALEHGRGISAMVITPISDTVLIDAPADLPVRHFVLNKTWESTDELEGVRFIGGVPDLGRDWVLGEILQTRPEQPDQ